MISGWLIKLLLGIAVVGFAVIELGSPLIARAQADDAAHDVADEAALALSNRRTVEAMSEQCAETAADKDVKLERCELDAEGRVAVTVTKTARSFLLYRFSQTKDWYQVEASATGQRR